MKNCDVLEFFPELPMARRPRASNFTCRTQGGKKHRACVAGLPKKDASRLAQQRPRRAGPTCAPPPRGLGEAPNLEPGWVILKPLPPDGLSTGPIVLDEISALGDEPFDDTMERAVAIAHQHARLGSLAPVAAHDGHKVLDRQGRDVQPNLEDHALRRHGERDATPGRPLKVIGIERLLDPLLLGTTQLLHWWTGAVSGHHRPPATGCTRGRPSRATRFQLDPSARPGRSRRAHATCSS
eukprot:scaffold6960_cov104-Isochrysis_galbana.AAC.1